MMHLLIQWESGYSQKYSVTIRLQFSCQQFECKTILNASVYGILNDPYYCTWLLFHHLKSPFIQVLQIIRL